MINIEVLTTCREMTLFFIQMEVSCHVQTYMYVFLYASEL